jgi:glycosyltransferase involved in cell wall biosynthesis
MRVLMLTTSYPKFRGDTTAPFIESIATHIAAAQPESSEEVEVHVVLPEHRDLNRSPIEDGVHFHAYRYALRREWTVWGYAEALRADVKLKSGVYALAPLALGSAVQTMLALTGRVKFDVIHAHWVLPNAPAAALVARLRGLPLVVSLHGSDVFMAEKNAAFSAAARWCFRRAGWIPACSDELLNRALALGADESKTELIPYGADAKAFHVHPEEAERVRRGLRLKPDDVLLLAVGRLVYKKGFEFLVAAMPEILRVAPNARLVLVGYGDLRDELEQQARELGLNGQVTFAGRVPRAEIPTYFAASDVVVVPSVRDAAGNVDGLPNVVLEGMAAGKPIVASNLAGFPDVIREGREGLLVPEKNPTALADAIVQLAHDPALRQQLGAAGRAQVHAKLNWENVALKFVDVYQRVLPA